MKAFNEKTKRILLFLLIIVLALIEFVFDMRRVGGRSGNALTVMIILAAAELFRDIKRASKGAKNEVPEQKFEVQSDSAALAKLDDMKNAGLINEKEYQRRKKELAGKAQGEL